MKEITLFVLFLVFFSCSSQKQSVDKHKGHEETEQDSVSNYILFDYINSLTEKDFITTLDSIKTGHSKDFFTLRMAYTKTKDYSPYDTDISDSLKKARSLVDSQKLDDALLVLENIQSYNYVNIASHLYCGYIYNELGDSLKSNFHYNISDGLLYSIYDSGDGVAPKTAYLVITTKEEYAFLNWFGLQFKQQYLISADGYSFDMMKAIDPKSNKEHEIYFNIEMPFDIMRKVFGE